MKGLTFLSEVPRLQREVAMRRSEVNSSQLPVCEVMASPQCSYVATDFHHRKLRSQGGGHNIGNCLMCCRACHRAIHADVGLSYEQGWLVKSHTNPLEAPCLRRGEYVVLDDEGGYTPEMEVN